MFLSSKNSNISSYQKIDKCFDLEVVDLSTKQIFDHFGLMKISQIFPVHKNFYFAKLDASNIGRYLMNNIIFPRDIKVMNKEEFLFNLNSSRFKLRFIMKVSF